MQSDANRVRTPPRSTPAFGPVRRADAPIIRAQRAATHRATRARTRVNRGTVAPALPKLAHATSSQRAHAFDLTRRSLRSQNLTPADVRTMPALQRKRINRGLGYDRTTRRNIAIRVALANRINVANHPPLPAGYRYGPDGTIYVKVKGLDDSWLPADSYANGPFGTAESLSKIHVEHDVYQGALRHQRQLSRDSQAQRQSQFDAQVEKIVSHVHDPATQERLLRGVVRAFTPEQPKHPRLELAKEGRAIARAHRAEGKPYEGVKVNVAGINFDLTDLARAGGNLVEKATAGLDPIPAAALRDVLTFPVGAVQAGAAIARATRDALGPAAFLTPLAPLAAADYALRPGAGTGGGNFKQAGALADAFTRGPLGELVIHGDPQAAMRSFREHPVYGALDFAAGYGAVGRVLGAAGRAGATVGDLARLSEGSAFMRASRALGDTRRASARLFPGSPQEVSRSYSKNALTKGLQKLQERRVARAGGDPTVIAERGPIADRLSGRTKALRQEVHEFASTEGEGVRRRGQQETAHHLVELVGHTAAGRIVRSLGKAGSAMAVAVLRRAKEGADDSGPIVDEAFRLEGKKLNRAARDTLAAMVEQRVELRADMSPAELKASILREHTRLADAAETSRHSWSGAERRLNRLQRRALWKAAHDETLLRSAKRLTGVRDRIVDMATTIEEGLIRAGVLDRRQALIAKVRPLAVARFGYRAMTPADRSRLEGERTTRVNTYVGLRRQLEDTQRELKRAHRKGQEGKVAELHAEVERIRARIGEYQTTLAGDELTHAQAVHERAASARSVDAARKRVERAERRQAKAMGGEAVRRGQKRRPGEKASEVADTTRLRNELAQLRKDGADEPVIAAKKAELEKAVVKAQSRARRKAEQELTQARAARDAATQRLKEAEKALEGRALRDFNMGLIDHEGRPVTTEDVLARMDREQIPLPGYIRQARGREAESFFRNWFRPGRRSRLSQGRRTGVAVERGGYASDWHALAESLMRRRGDLDSIQTWDRFVHRFGLVKEDGQMLTPREVQPWLEEHGFLDFEGNPAPGMPELVAVWAYPKSAERGSIAAMQNVRPLDESVGGRMLVAPRDAMNDVLGRQKGSVERAMEHDVLGPAEELRPGGKLADVLKPMKGEAADRRIVLMPSEQLRAFRDHQQTGTTTAGKLGQALTNTFRGTVLPFSTKWLTGNVFEAFLRLAVAGARVDDMWRGHKVLRELKKLDEEAYHLLKIRSLGGLFYGSAERLRVYSGAERFEHTSLEGVARTLESLGTPRALINSMSPQELLAHTAALLPRSMFSGLAMIGHGVFRLNRWFETESQVVALGRYARERGMEFSQSWFKALVMQRDALEQVVKGLTETPEQIRFARYVDETLGKYARFSPQTRRIIQTIAPFLPWYLNSLRFVLHTLPVKHPVLTSLIARTEAVMQPDMEKLRGEVPPGDLEAALPAGADRYLTLARYTPFGAFTSGLDVVTDPILPQIVTSFGILKYGVNFTGRPLDIGDREHEGRNIPGGKRALMALSSQLEAMLPFMQIARRLQEHGETPYDDSYLWAPHTKPDTATGSPLGKGDVGDAIWRIFYPFRPVVLRPQESSSGATSLDALPAGERRAIEGEARRIATEQHSTAADAEQRAIEDEARRILAAQGGG